MGESQSRHIVGMGGFPGPAVWENVLDIAGGRRVLVDRTASPQYADPIELPGELTDLTFYPWPPADLRDLALGSDVILVCGGSTANMLAVWRLHGFDRILREAWEAGVVLAGWSAGMICWFEAGVTDSFGPLPGTPGTGPRLSPDASDAPNVRGLSPGKYAMRDGLGFLPGSACPHYDGEERRRPVYTELVANGFPPGIALDDGVAAYYRGTELVELLASTPTGRGYHVGPDGEVPLPTRVVTEP